MRPASRTREQWTPSSYDWAGFYDEAIEPDGSPRPGYERVLSAIDDSDLDALQARTRAHPAARAASFGLPGHSSPFPIDPVPRIVPPEEWAHLERGLTQRVRALNAFLADVYGERRILDAQVISARALDGCEYFEPWMIGVPVPAGHATVIGFDIVRGSDGRLRVLEDNTRTPSGLAYLCAARRVIEDVLPESAQLPKLPVDECFEVLGRALSEAAPPVEAPAAVLLSDGPSNTAWYEHRTLARRLAIPLVHPSDLRERDSRLFLRLPSGRLRPIDVVYRRTDEDRLKDAHGRATWLAELLLKPLRAGRLAVLNAPGAGAADDKLIHAYVEDFVRFYLREEPLVESVRTYDLSQNAQRVRALGRLSGLVIKPRAGHGGHGIVIGPRAAPWERERIAQAVRAESDKFVAQEMVMLSRHPTVCEARLQPRHVDLRAFAITTTRGTYVVPGGLTRVALERDSLIVNSSKNGGGKDTWVLR